MRPTAPTKTVQINQEEKDCLGAINYARANPDGYMAGMGFPVGPGGPANAAPWTGQGPLPIWAWDDICVQCAQQWSLDMASHGWYSEGVNPDNGWRMSTFLQQSGFPVDDTGYINCATLCSERLNHVFETVGGWAADWDTYPPKHRNVLFEMQDPAQSTVFQVCGVGVAYSADRGQLVTCNPVYDYVPYLLGSCMPDEIIWACCIDNNGFSVGRGYHLNQYSLRLPHQGKWLVTQRFGSYVVPVSKNMIVELYEDDRSMAPPISNLEWLTWLYGAYLGREFDVSGREYWRVQMENGASRHEVKANFLNSLDFLNLPDWYEAVYLTVFLRSIRQDERDWWAQQEAAGKNKMDIAREIVAAPEAQKGL